MIPPRAQFVQAILVTAYRDEWQQTANLETAGQSVEVKRKDGRGHKGGSEAADSRATLGKDAGTQAGTHLVQWKSGERSQERGAKRQEEQEQRAPVEAFKRRAPSRMGGSEAKTRAARVQKQYGAGRRGQHGRIR